MTLRHIVLMRFPDGIDEDFLKRMDRAIVDMAKAIPEVKASTGGRDVSTNPENWHYAIIYDFADVPAYERYRVHPAHKQFIADYMRGPKIDKTRIQLTLP
jgi:hypothetical protein